MQNLKIMGALSAPFFPSSLNQQIMSKEHAREVKELHMSETEHVLLMRLINAAYEAEMDIEIMPGEYEIRPLGLMLSYNEHLALERLFSKFCLDVQ